MSSLKTRCLALAAALAFPTAVLAAGSAQVSDAWQRPASMAKHPQGSVFLGGAVAGDRLVVVGERGMVLTSDDAVHWQQRPTPVSDTLTSVRFADARHGVAVGHAGVVLATEDGGATWSVVLDGRQAADLVLRAAPGDEAAQRLVADGPDKPLLDALFADPSRMVVVGAYGLILASSDGGKTWESWMNRVEDPQGLHYYAIRQRGDEIVIAGEQGLVLRSQDRGATFKSVETPYKGSFFTLELPGEHGIVVAGLRGNAWMSDDDGAHWVRLPNDVDAAITSSLSLPDGSVLFGDQAGRVLELIDGTLSAVKGAMFPSISGLVSDNGKHIVALTMQGIRALK